MKHARAACVEALLHRYCLLPELFPASHDSSACDGKLDTLCDPNARSQ